MYACALVHNTLKFQSFSTCRLCVYICVRLRDAKTRCQTRGRESGGGTKRGQDGTDIANRLTASKVATARGHAPLPTAVISFEASTPPQRGVFIYARRRATARNFARDPSRAVACRCAQEVRSDERRARAGRAAASPRQEPTATLGRRGGRDQAAVSDGVARKALSRKVSIEQHCVLLNRPIAAITTEDVPHPGSSMKCPSFAQITKARIEDVFTFAQARGLLPLQGQPGRPATARVLVPTPPKAVPRAALPYADVPALLPLGGNPARRQARRRGAGAGIHDPTALRVQETVTPT